MKFSVVVCTYSMDRYDDVCEAIESVLAQSYEPVEIIVVIDGKQALADRIQNRFAEQNSIVVHCNDRNRGLSYSRTKGIEVSSGEVIAFIDDDAIAKPDWIEALARGYERTDAVAVGGRMVPEWVAEKPSFLPEEFYWLIGANYEERMDDWSEVRNTLGSNMSFRREVFERVGGFDEGVGLTEDNQIQAEETELAIRMYDAFGKGMLYVPEAVVAHKVFEYRTRPAWLVKRAFWQGYSKRVVEQLDGEGPGNEEANFLRHLITSSIPLRVADLVCHFRVAKVQQLIMLFVLTACVGVGYVYGWVRSLQPKRPG